jgi:chromosomal replication initiator protein
VCGCFDVTDNDLRSNRRDKGTVEARHVAMWLSKSETTWSFVAIGRSFGDRHHTSIMHAVRRVDERMRRDPVYRGVVIALRDGLAGV